ncbi:MAG: helix-turn-helix domain-containing protein [Desulfovibrio fairfieldensis]
MVGKVSEDNAMFPALQRFFEAAGCRTQTDLAKFLDISQSSISDAKRREVIPAEWLLKLLRNRGVNPDWILTGEGVHYLRSAEPGESAFPAERVIEIRPPEQCSAQELINELVRRALGERMGCETS